MRCFDSKMGLTGPGRLLWMVVLVSGVAFAQLKPGEYPEPNCGSGADAVKPVALPLQNITINADYNPPIVSLHKCLSVSFGSNQRKALCVGIGTNLNSTIVSSNRQEKINQKDPVYVCDPRRDILNPKAPQDQDYRGCLAFRGGLYDSDSEKSTFQKYQNTGDFSGNVPNNGFEAAKWEARFSSKEDPFAEFSRGTDQIQFGRDGKLDDYPLILLDRYDFAFGTSVMGLATESVFLKHAVVAKQIPSRAWGFEYGKREDTDGELVLGGYNADKFDISKATEFPVFPNKGIPCPLQVKVKSMSWGTFSAGPFDACVEPTYHTTVLPLSVQKDWNSTWLNYGWSYIGESWEHFDYNNTNLDAVLPTEDMTITLENGFTVDIPIINFWNVYRSVEGKSGVYKQTEHKISTRVGNGGFNSSIGESPEVAFLGGPFLSQLYLAVDYEVNKFYLQKLANPEDRKLQTWREPQNLKVLGCEGVSSKGGQTTGTDGETDGKKKLPTWAIALIVLVAVLTIIGILLLALFLLKRAHKRRDAAAATALASASNASPSAGGLQVGGPESYGYTGKNGPPGPIRSETAYSQVSELPYTTPSSPPPSHAPAYSEIYSSGTVSSMGTGTGLVGQQANWNGASPNWGSPVPSPGYPVQPTATGYAPVEMPGGEGIAEMGTSAPAGGLSEKR